MSDPKMSGKVDEQKAEAKARGAARREQIRIRVEKLRQSRQRSMYGMAEIAGLAASLLLLVLAVFAYLYFLVPSYSRLDALQRERTFLQEQLRASEEGVRTGESAQATVEEINLSVEKFETQRLPSQNEGRMALYNSLNQMIKSNGLRNTSGPTYSALEALGARAPGQPPTPTNVTGQRNAKWQSLFPGLGVSVTVEGPYANLRRFVRDLEASNQFIIINAVELEKATDADIGATPIAATGSPPGAAAQRATLVSLRVELAAYFRRGASTSETAEPAGASETR